MGYGEFDRQIDYIEFQTTDIPATKRFYSDVFGWTFVDYGPDYVAFENSGTVGGFQKVDKVTSGGALVVIHTKNIAELEAKVKEHGGEVIMPTYEFPGGRRFHFADPSGNILAVWSE